MIEYFPQDQRYYLQNEFIIRTQRRSKYSMRAFARDIGVSPGSLCEFLNGNTRFSKTRVQEISKTLNLPLKHVDHWLDLIDVNFNRSPIAKKKAQLCIDKRLRNSKKFLDLDSFELISNWEYLALMELLSFEQIFSANQLAKNLGVSQNQIDSMLKVLLRLGLIRWNENRWVASEEDTYVGENRPSNAIKNFHKGILNKAKGAIDKQSIDQRELSALVFSMQINDLQSFKQDLNKALFDLSNKYAGKKNCDAVYCLSTQLFNILDQE